MVSYEDNVTDVEELFANCDDFVSRRIKIAGKKASLFYLKDMINDQKLNKIEQRISIFLRNQKEENTAEPLMPYMNQLFPFTNIKESTGLQVAANEVLVGNMVLMVEEENQFFTFQTADSVGREVSEPTTEPAVIGPKEGFVEDIQTNLMLVRKRLLTTNLKVENLTLGKQTQTKLSIVYIDGIASEDIVNEVKERLSRIKIDGILESQYIESMIKDSPKSPFPTIYSTERPDRVCGGLLDGKVAIFIDGTSFVLTVPVVFVEFLHAGDDYYDSSLVATIVRWVRFLGLFVTLILPAFYVGLTTFHQDLLQTPFLIRIAASRESLPYPALVEAIFLYITYELIREAGMRMPKTLGGGVVTILGLVLVGQAGVQAGIVGPVLAIVMIVTSLTSFILPNYRFHQVIRFAGFPILLLAGLFGFMGIIVALMFGLTHLVSLRSFGVPYFSPVSPSRKEGWKDVFIRAPWWAMDTRPPGLDIENIARAGAENYSKLPNKEKGTKDD
ncbi:spore germination protein [Neobacillus cucumis]|uniref:spore germination protein n=1 Tax=Neobacillus cucumis TaxID=1740721 RepID=UPI0018DF147D|nr:spore germination protein [Neobacillus cucumis]MBI0579582.1 spore germination protein [Neobacillus cucumis]